VLYGPALTPCLANLLHLSSRSWFILSHPS